MPDAWHLPFPDLRAAGRFSLCDVWGGNAVGGADSGGVGVYRRRVYPLFVVEVR